MQVTIQDAVGMLGTAMVIVSYLLLQLNRISSDDLVYSLANALGAALILYSLYFDFNLSAVVIESFWVFISMIGVWKYVRARSANT